jgi:hypothetical protein
VSPERGRRDRAVTRELVDALTVNATSNVRPVSLTVPSTPETPTELDAWGASPGDLLQIIDEGSPIIGWVAVPEPLSQRRVPASGPYPVDLANGLWFRPAVCGDFASSLRPPSDRIHWLVDPARARWLTGGDVPDDSGAAADPEIDVIGFGWRTDAFVLETDHDSVAAIAGGSWIA